MDAEQVKAALAEYIAAAERGDIDAYMSCYEDDAVWMMPRTWEDVRRDAAREFYARILSSVRPVAAALNVAEVIIAGEWAVVRYTYRGGWRGGDGTVSPGGSRHMTLLHRGGDGRWRIARDIWNNPPIDAP